jgi:hypothetical protein
VTEADEKYSAVISAPFPLSVLNFAFGTVVLGAKNPQINWFVLHLYYFPLMLCLIVVFTAYQLIILPFAYLKICGHKWALMVHAPRGKGSSSTLDRAGQALLFMILGVLILVLNLIVDTWWFVSHLYKTNLDKTITKKEKQEVSLELPEIHRITYKKMLAYFSVQNDQLVLEKSVALDLRKYLDVDEALRCKIYGKPTEIDESKMNLYLAYAKQTDVKTAGSDPNVQDEKNPKTDAENTKDETQDDDFFSIEHIVDEYATIKTVLLNNSFPVDIEELQRGTT